MSQYEEFQGSVAPLARRWVFSIIDGFVGNFQVRQYMHYWPKKFAEMSGKEWNIKYTNNMYHRHMV